MYELPKISDFQRTLDVMIHESEHTCRTELGRIKASLAARGLLRSGSFVSEVIGKYNEIHDETTTKAMHIAHEFISKGSFSPDDLIPTLRNRLENFAVFLTANVPLVGFDTQQAIVISGTCRQYAEVFRQRMEGAIRDFEIGMIKGSYVEKTKTKDNSRQKSEKFGILDSPKLYEDDLKHANGLLGTVVIYLDIDNFKSFNTKYSETVVDSTLLPAFQKLISDTFQNLGFSYAEGGDEIKILLPNSSVAVAQEIIGQFKKILSEKTFLIDSDHVTLNFSAGIAYAPFGADKGTLSLNANFALREAKELGKNQIRFYSGPVEARVL